jgi:hypothetical protein
MNGKNILSVFDDGVSAFRLELDGVTIFASYTLADNWKHAAWMVAVCNQELYWENGKRVSAHQKEI